VQQQLDYGAVGLKVGLEVHQQLLTATKLFCHCPAGLYTSEHDGSVLRHMRPTLSELGEYDGTALMEFKTRKNIIYLLNEANTCTYEMDDTPPFLVNQEALDIAIEQCLMLGCDIVDEVHIARKQYLDGSIPTGFQRTAIVGVNGRLPFRGRELSITQVSVEEDSCREVSDQGHLIVWRTDRLGMPLIETVTGPDLRTPEEVADAILLVGRVCRSTGHVRVGCGASRQDVNVSVRGGTRIEIKGVPRAGWAPGLVHGEAVRQVNLLALREELHRRGFTEPDAIQVDHRDVTRFFANSPMEQLHEETWRSFQEDSGRRSGFECGDGPFTVLAVVVPRMAGVLNLPGQPEHTFAHELKGRVRVISGLDQLPILYHSDAWPDDPLSKQVLTRLRKRLRCDRNDLVIVVWGAEGDTRTAAEEIRIRLADATQGVPSETRQPFPDGTTDFERILPGPDRMYPDTDSPPQRVTRDRVEGLADALPDPPWVREERWAAAGLDQPTIHYLIRRGGARLVELVSSSTGLGVAETGRLFGQRWKMWSRSGFPLGDIGDDQWLALGHLLAERPVLTEVVDDLVVWMCGHPETDPAVRVAEAGYGEAPAGWRDHVRTAAGGLSPDRPSHDPQQRLRFAMGRLMPPLRGRVEGRRVAEVVRKAIAGASDREARR
jgi:glutamyl-tRNA(Gln) amidotransferase subunit E